MEFEFGRGGQAGSHLMEMKQNCLAWLRSSARSLSVTANPMMYRGDEGNIDFLTLRNHRRPSRSRINHHCLRNDWWEKQPGPFLLRNNVVD